MPNFKQVRMMTIVFDVPNNPNDQGEIEYVTVWEADGTPHSPEKKDKGTHKGDRHIKKNYGDLEIEEGTTCIIIGGTEWCF